jgi:hypothetical protein
VTGATRSGLLAGVISFLANLGLGVIFPICGPVCGIVWGTGAGILAVIWTKEPEAKESPARLGALAGAIAGVGAIVGLMLGMFLQFGVMGGQQLSADLTRDLAREFGLPISGGEALIVQQWIGAIGAACCIGLVNLAVMSGAGALAAQLFASTRD